MAQKIIFLGNVLNRASFLENEEIKALCSQQFGDCDLSIGETENPKELQEWLELELHKSYWSGDGRIYKMKTPLDELKEDGVSNEFSGPISIHVFWPDAAKDKGIFHLSCNGKGTPLYIVGIIADEDDLEKIIATRLKCNSI